MIRGPLVSSTAIVAVTYTSSLTIGRSIRSVTHVRRRREIQSCSLALVVATVLRRGNVRIEGQRLPIAAVTATNDLIGLRDDAEYLAWMESQWLGLVTRRQLRRWLSDGVPALLARAAEQLRERGTLPYGELAPFLETVERTGPDRITVPTLPSLAAWALSRSADSAVTVSTCGECGLPWISRQSVDYCYRPAPGKTMTCAQLHAHARFAEQRAAWNREYRRIYARKLRGTITDTDWRRWVTAAQTFREATRWRDERTDHPHLGKLAEVRRSCRARRATERPSTGARTRLRPRRIVAAGRPDPRGRSPRSRAPALPRRCAHSAHESTANASPSEQVVANPGRRRARRPLLDWTRCD